MATISERLKEIISIRNVKQAEIVEHTGINKGSLSSYISGRYLPKQDNIYRLAKYFGVNPAWLMGLDVPMQEVVISKQEILHPDDSDLVNRALEYYKQVEELPSDGRKQLEEYLSFLLSKYDHLH